MPNKSSSKPQLACDVVVVNFNAGAYLVRCVESIYQSDVLVSLCIVDNASVDTSVEQAKRLNPAKHQLKIIQNQENLGFSKGVNQGAKQGSAPYLLLLNPDCEIYPHTIHNLLKEAEQCVDIGVLGALVFNEDGTEQRGCRRLEPTFVRSVVTALRLGKYFQSVNLQYDDLPSAPVSIDAVSGSAMLIRRDVFEAIGGMDEGYFLHVEDLDFCRRVRELGKKIYFTPNVSLFHHHGASSHNVPVHTEWHKHQGMLRYQEKFQKPNQSAIRSLLTRGVIYMNFALSVLRKRLSRQTPDNAGVQSLINTDKAAVIVTGASSDVGQAVLRKLQDQKNVIAVSRQAKYPKRIRDERWFNWSFFEKVPTADCPQINTWLALSPVWAAPSMGKTLSRCERIERVIALSSTSILAKASTSDAKEQAVVQKLKMGEAALLEWAEIQKADLTICRASMIYGGEHNQNIAFIKRVIKWLRFFPMLSEGKGLRQPVHVDDLAQAVQRLSKMDKLPQQIYTLAGGEQLNYRNMIKRVFDSMAYKENIKIVPKSLLLRVAGLLSVIPGLRFINREMVKRMEQDLAYDIQPAEQDFGYAPGKFRP